MNALDTALFNKLTADTGAGGIVTLLGSANIFNILAPQGTTGRYLIYQDVSETPEYTLTEEYYRRMIYRLKIYDQGEDWSVIGQVADRLETLLIDGTLTITGWLLRRLRLQQRFSSAETDNQGIIAPMILMDFIIEVVEA